jgi:VWFA-related protein
MTICSSRAAFGAGALVVSFALAVAVPDGQEAQQPPSFRSGIELVAVDFLALDGTGRPLSDLTPDEIAIKLDGRLRPIRSVHWIQLADPPLSGDPAAIVPAPFGSNTRADAGRAILIALDDESLRTGREAPLRRAVNRFLSALSPRDRVALVTMPYGGVKVDFTNEHDKVGQILSTIAGQASRGDEDGSQAACRTRRTLESLLGLLNGLGTPESPTTVMFFTTALSGPRRDAPVMLAPGQCELKVELFQQVGVAASDARAQFYVIQPEDPPIVGALQTENIAGANFRGSDNPVEGIEHLSGATGARRLHLATAGDDTLLRVLDETAGYYLVAFEPEPRDRNGERHRLEVTAARAAEVRVRPDLLISRAGTRKPANTPQSMLRAAKVFRELPLRAIGYASRDAAGKVKVVAMAEPVEPAVQIRSASAAVFDAQGKLTAQSTADAAALASTPVVLGLVAPQGVYRLRVAATDSEGRAGTADYEFSAELVPAGPLTVSSVMLGLSRSGGFIPRMLFGSEPVAIAYMEIYGDPGASPVSVMMELAGTPDGPARLSIPGAVSATRAADRRIATGAIPIGALPPGDYIVRAVVAMEGQPAGRVSQTIRKTR